MDKKFRIPALLIIVPPILTVVWFILNTDQIGTVLFGEKLDYCNVVGCAVTRTRFFDGAIPLFAVFILGLLLIIIRSIRGGKDA